MATDDLEFFDDFEDEGAARPQRTGMVWNILTLLTLLATVCLLGYFVTIFVNPYSGLNPFPPPTMPPTLGFPTPTPTLPFATLPPTWTPSPTLTPLPTNTPKASPTPVPTATATFTPTPAVTPTPTATPPYGLQPGAPVYLSSQIWHPDQGCNYLGVAGQVLDVNGQPLVGVPVAIKVEGTLADTPVSEVALPGTAPHVGPAGFEIMLSDHPIASSGTLYIQVVDLNNFLPLSEPVYFDTHDSCDENIVVIYFQRKP